MHQLIIKVQCTRARVLIIWYRHHIRMKVKTLVHMHMVIMHMIHKLEHLNEIKY